MTRRRLIQGVGALGVAGVAGNALVSANDGAAAVQEDQAALRVAHAAPDTPSIAVTLRPADGGAGGATTDGGTGTATTVGGDGPLVEGLEFSNVSSYNEVEPGTYQLRVIATESTGFLEGIFGDAEKRVIYDDEVELQAGTTYTAVAYGTLRASDLGDSPSGTETPGAGGETETDAGVGAETPTETAQTPTDDEGVIGEETPTDETDTPGIGEETETDAGGTGGDGQVVIDRISYGEHQTFTLDAGDYTLRFREPSAGEEDTGGTGEATPTETDALGAEETPTDDAATPTDGGTTGSEDGSGSDRAFTVDLLEDDLSAPGDSAAGGEGTTAGAETPTDDAGVIGQETETPGESPTGGGTATDGASKTRLTVFHAVVDIDVMEVVAVEDDGDGGGGLFGGGGQETETQTGAQTQTPTDDGGIGGGDEQTPTAGAETETETGGEVPPREAEVSLEAGTVYTGFAMGYFDPEAAETAQPTATDAGDGAGVETETDGGVGAGQTETPTATTPTATGTTDQIAEEGAEEFQFVTVEDASGGERADGGTGGGGILPDESAPEAPSD
ncbi:hypothetical protein [Halosimplex aquaticum]|uniref:hypothetical protein n=1 Tax=Halosimplex aquaticum TaxID=3026162 RepID=UPI0023679125|nr:hypothetical protein [Halosimplex aquaticum]